VVRRAALPRRNDNHRRQYLEDIQRPEEVSGSPGCHSRLHSRDRWPGRRTFDDGSTGIVVTQVPSDSLPKLKRPVPQPGETKSRKERLPFLLAAWTAALGSEK
jgi:hypothetical protein